MSERFAPLERFADEGNLLELTDDPSSIAPERALVFEVIGSGFPQFAEKAQQIGLDFLFEQDDVSAPSADFILLEGGIEQPDRALPVFFYLTMPTEDGLRQLLRLWRIYKAGEDFPRGFTAWRNLFDHLNDVRPWGPQDRVLEEDLQQFTDDLAGAGNGEVRCEIELWFSDDANTRASRVNSVTAVVQANDGDVITSASISEIRYLAILCSLPANKVEEFLTGSDDVELLNADGVMYIRPQSCASIDSLELVETEAADAGGPESEGVPLAALFDGMPIENHVLLQNRLIVDDPDDLAARYVSLDSRMHGTEMASLILHGDINEQRTPMTRPLYVRPLLCKESELREEHFPGEVLLVDYVHRAVRRMFEGEDDQEPSAPSVRIINLSLGDASKPFARRVSSWARLLDFLSSKYFVLFIVSAGNHQRELSFEQFATLTEMQEADPMEVQAAVLTSVHEEVNRRSILSPAESINALTVGCAHEDALRGTPMPLVCIDPYVTAALPNVGSALGLGYRGSVKPEINVAGGRGLLRFRAMDERGLTLTPNSSCGSYCGVRAAVPGQVGQLGQTANIVGTSAAAALATRNAVDISEALLEFNPEIIDDDRFLALYAKALMVHHAKVDESSYQMLAEVVYSGQSSAAKKRDVARYMGFGTMERHFEPGCDKTKAILIGHNSIDCDDEHVYRLPIPQSISGLGGFRAINVTLAWFSPINARHQMYRSAKLDVDVQRVASVDGAGVPQLDPHSRGKATVFHARFEGRNAVQVEADGSCEIKVKCLGQTGDLTGSVPYAIAASFEVGVDSAIDVYADIRARLAVPIRG